MQIKAPSRRWEIQQILRTNIGQKKFNLWPMFTHLSLDQFSKI